MKITRRKFISGTAAAVSTAALFPYCGLFRNYKGKEYPNILWIVSEDNSPEYLGCYGNKMASTPNIDRLAGDGVKYTNAFANSPVCAPARNTIITGMYSTSTGTQHMRSRYRLPDNVRFFTEYMREAGYYCTNRFKEDYNCAITPKGAWDRNMDTWFWSWRIRSKGQPFFHVINLATTHESALHLKDKKPVFDPLKIKLPPHHPDTPEFRHDYARYYDQHKEMDSQVGTIFKQLEEQGNAEDTIIFYYGDHGGVLPYSKRFLVRGLRVPLIIKFPEKYRHLAPGKPGSEEKRLVSFIDFAPTMLDLIGLPVPDYMQGNAFLGKGVKEPPEFAFGFIDRTDENSDMSRAAFTGRYKYIRNYYPHRKHGYHMEYLNRMPSMRSWRKEYRKGTLNDKQRTFFEKKPVEELYDMHADPYQVNNLAGKEKFRGRLKKMREACSKWSEEIYDSGFLSELEMVERSKGTTVYEMLRDHKRYNLPVIKKAAQFAGEAGNKDINKLIKMLKSEDSGVRYWGIVGIIARGDAGKGAADDLLPLLEDPSKSIRLTAAEALCKIGHGKKALPVLMKALGHENKLVRKYAAETIGRNQGQTLTID